MSEVTNTQSKPGPLDGIRVIEYGVFHAGPGAGAILGDMGADVIKIETLAGDPERYWTGIGSLDLELPNGESVMHDVSNRNKRGICLDIKQEKGREIFNRLVEGADVFLTNLRKTTKTKLAVDYESISKINPKIIHANVSGYGPEGPLSDLGAFDPLGMARSGMMFITGADEPRLCHLGILDQATAIAASYAVMTALFVRERNGIGQEVHVSLFSTGMWLTYCNLVLNAISKDPTASGERSQHSPLRNAFCCKDGKWLLGTHHPEDRYWPTFCKATGQEDLLEDERFSDKKTRTKHNPELVALFDKVFAEKTHAEWMELFVPLGLMFSPVQTSEEVLQDPQAIINGYMTPFQHPRLGDIQLPGYPIGFSENQAGTKTPAPSLGEHTDVVLKEIGCTDQEIEDLKQAGIAK